MSIQHEINEIYLQSMESLVALGARLRKIGKYQEALMTYRAIRQIGRHSIDESKTLTWTKPYQDLYQELEEAQREVEKELKHLEYIRTSQLRPTT